MLEIKDILPEMIEFRKELHRHPELAGNEVKTCAAIRRCLAAIPGVEVLPPFLETDTVALIRGNGPGKNVTLRADIDGLVVDEACDIDYRSEVPGMMHACGHDVHTAILMGAAKLLAARREEFCGSVRLVFQPGEENKAMARPLIAAGALDDPPADFVAALHCEPGMKVGSMGIRVGAMMSSCQHFEVVFTGKGGHGSRPHAARNPLTAACAAVMELQTVVSNRIDSQRAGVLSICAMHCGKLDNVIAEEAVFIGTLRALDDETATDLREALQEICEAVAKIHRVGCAVHIAEGGYPATVNPAEGVVLAKTVMAECGINCVDFTESSMASEDFSYFLHKAPCGVFVKLGAGENLPPLHNPAFLASEEAIPYGIDFMTNLALAALK